MNEIYRIGLRFGREGMTRFNSHLDIHRMFGRALRRAGLPLVYSQGFNPHIELSFAQALAVGLATKGDYLEFALTEKLAPQAVLDAIEMPEGFCVTAAGYLDKRQKKLMAAVTQAVYELRWHCADCEAKKALDSFVAADSFIMTKKKQGKPARQFDARPRLLEVKLGANAALVRLSLDGESSLSPFDLLAALGGAGEADILRLDLMTGSINEPSSLETLFMQTAHK